MRAFVVIIKQIFPDNILQLLIRGQDKLIEAFCFEGLDK